jgi:UDP-N-acetyl-2-amino-2-deoxyglucuronate dehydrogenase
MPYCHEKLRPIGAVRFIAPRHMAAIGDTGNVVVAAFDPNASVGVMGIYFPDAHLFNESERFDWHIESHRRSG